MGPDVLDVDGDASPPSCGNGTVDQGESCDGSDFAGITCQVLGHDNGELQCTTGCQLDDSDCSTCGNDLLEADEQCDGSELAGADCESLGYLSGTLSCAVNCVFNVSGCFGCGDGVVTGAEQCDGPNLNGQTCSSLGFTGGTLLCDPVCAFDTSNCNTCGDGVQTTPEDCDATDFGGDTCLTLGYDGGTLSCTLACFFNEADCSTCGNAIVETAEQCDGTNLGGGTCLTQGYDGGTLSCDGSCAFDATLCTTCGDGAVEGAEECDDASANSNSTPDACRENCVNPWCGDGVCDTAELGQLCPADCSVTLFSENFDGGWSSGWSTGDNLPGCVTQDCVDTWAPSTNRPHNGTHSAWCAEDGNNSSDYDNNMQSWAAHTLDLSSAAGQAVFLDVWIWVHVAETADWFSMLTSNDGGGSWPTLEVFNGNTGGWVFRSYDISFGAGNGAFGIGLFFNANGWTSDQEGAYVDDIVVRRVQ
ncbi:MAG: hypothetical protein ABI333_20210 [bacterium]